jgi:lipopolysaccharide/colanic/teichoic acid biosynthesis glycosyltransferase
VQPGLTGWAQVCHGYTNSVDGQRRKVEYDLYYVKHASLRLDLRIMARTAMVILRLKGL